ncbi:MAG: 3-dehydroquinate synthase [Planctomycetota bacterium]|nr:3-dehydroquinate synthase [Planctomycetota bacterium]
MPHEPTLIHVALGQRSYEIAIGAGNLPTLGRFITERSRVTHAVVITDTHVQQPYAEQCVASLADTGARVDVVVIAPGEASKSVETAKQLWLEFCRVGADRKSVVVAVGGGVIGDLAGFAAATFARGLAFVQVPTTLLAHVDSSVGGKVGVNLPAAKNMVGAFWQPLAVLIDTDSLTTLPVREYRAGLAEVVKYGVILDAEFFAYLEHHVDALNRRQTDVLQHVIARCCRIKADVVEQDEREVTGLRAVLNYGHTFAHAFESETGYERFLHGEAVSLGMVCASRLAEKMGRVDAQLTRRQHDLLAALGLPVRVPDLAHQALLAAMQRDKKVEHGQLRFVLPTRMGHVELVPGVPEELVRAALAD